VNTNRYFVILTVDMIWTLVKLGMYLNKTYDAMKYSSRPNDIFRKSILSFTDNIFDKIELIIAVIVFPMLD